MLPKCFRELNSPFENKRSEGPRRSESIIGRMPKRDKNEFTTLQMKPGEAELLRLRNQTNAVGALAELVWNSLDADATRIQVDWTHNELMGVESISVVDNGHGIPYDDKRASDHVFMTLGDSRKHTVVHQSPGGRILHGRFGKGRLRALALGGVIRWDTTFAKSMKTRKSYALIATVGESTIEVSRLRNTKGPTGTSATVEFVSEKGNGLDVRDVRRRFALIFAEHLANYPKVKIFIQGEPLEPESIIESRHELGQQVSNLSKSESVDWNLRAVQWKASVSDSKGRLFLCDTDKLVLAEHELNLRGAEGYTFYLDCDKARDWEADGLVSLRDDAQQVFAEARLKAHRFLRSSFHERAATLSEELKEQRLYPFPSAPKDRLRESEEKLFSQCALHIKQGIGSYEKMNLPNKRLLFKLLQEVLHREPSRAAEIVTAVLKLSPDEKRTLEKMVEETASLKGELVAH